MDFTAQFCVLKSYEKEKNKNSSEQLKNESGPSDAGDCGGRFFFCFQGADFEVHIAKIIQAEVAKRKLNLLFTVENANL